MQETAKHSWAAPLVPIFVGLVSSTLLLVDYIRPAPVFCAVDGGCEVMKHTAYAAVLGIRTPIWGIAVFLLFAALTLMRGAFARLSLLAISSLSALGAVFLISVQVRLGVFCTYCMTVDLAILFVLGLALYRFRKQWDPPEPMARRSLAAVGAVLAIAIPAAIGITKKPTVPEPVAREIAVTPPGKVTIVDFVDFECPFCRETHAEVAPIVLARKDQLRVVRKNVPLSRIHPHAMDAARAACCGEGLGKGDDVANALFTLPVEELTPEGCLKMAQSLGLDAQAFKACMASPSTDAKIKADSEAFKATHGHGLPTLWVNDQVLEGAQDGATVGKAIDRAIADKS